VNGVIPNVSAHDSAGWVIPGSRARPG
jgi:hypothetical protein